MSNLFKLSKFSPKTRSQVFSVLKPIIRISSYNHKDSVLLVSRLSKLWKDRVNSLSSYNINPITIHNMNKCPPSMVYCHTRINKCNNSLCPWCWCRNIINVTFDNVQNALSKIGKSDIKNVRLIVYDKSQTFEAEPLESTINNFQYEMRKFCLKSMKDSNFIGLISFLVIDPLSDELILNCSNKDSNFTVNMRFLILCRKDLPFNYVVYKIKNPNITQISNAISKFCLYPSGIVNGNLETTANIFKTKSKFRFIRYYGIFSNSHKNKSFEPQVKKKRR